MVPLTGVSFLALSLSLLLVHHGRRWLLRLGTALGLLVAATGVAAMVGILAPFPSPDLLGVTGLEPAGQPTLEGWPAPNTAFSLMLTGGGLAVLSVARRWRTVILAQLAVLLAGSVAVLALAGYAYGVGGLYGLGAQTPMALSTAVAMLLASAGVLHLRPVGIMGAVAGRDVGSVSARRLLPAVILLPIVLGWIILAGERAQFYDRGFAMSLVVVSMIVLFAILVWWNAESLRQIDLQRTEAEAAVRESEQRFRALALNASEAIVTIDQEDRIHFVNPAAARIFGHDLGGLYDRRFTDLMPAEMRDGHRQGMRRYLASGKRRIPWDGVELPGLHSSGEHIPLEVTFSEYERDGTRYFTGIMRDISSRKQAEEERTRLLEGERAARAEAERRAREETALRRAAEAVTATFTIDDVIREIAQNALSATGSDGAFVERIDHDLERVEVVAAAGKGVPEIDLSAPYEGSFAAQAVQHVEPLVVPDLTAADAPILGELAKSCGRCAALIIPLLNGGAPIGALVLTRIDSRSGFREDEVARARTFAELAALAFRKVHLLHESERRREEVERVTESRTRLIRGFSHDLKNPLGAADGHLQLLEDEILGELQDRQRQSVERARRSIAAALRLINDLVALARAEAGQIDLQLDAVDLRSAAREMAEEYRASAEAKGIRLDLDLPDRFPLIRSDPNRVRQVLGNLISNAVKYTDDGSVRVRLQLRDGSGKEGQGWGVVEVEDTGIGIPEDQLRFLFQEFSRLSADEREGVGLGLAISQKVAQALGGRIAVRSKLGEGSTFALLLPLED